jgi:hypothetical protein
MRRLLLATVLALAAGAAQADEDDLFYLGAGVSNNKISEITAINSDLNSTSWKAYVGVRPINAFAVEADYLDLGSKTLNTTTASGTINTDVNYKAFAGYAVGFVPLPLPYLDVFGKVGLARWSSGGSTNSPGASLFSLSDNGTEFAWGIGAQAHFGMVGGRLEYEAFHIQNTNGAGILSLSVYLRL